MIATPSRRSVSMMPKSCWTSDSVRAEVGSSMMMRRLSSDSARAISTSCCSATDSAETGVSGSMRQVDAGEDARAPRAASAASPRGPGGRAARGR